LPMMIGKPFFLRVTASKRAAVMLYLLPFCF